MNSLRNDIVKRARSHHVYVPLGRKREGGKERERGKETVLSMPESIGPVSKHRSRIIRSKGEASTRHVTSTGNARRALIRSNREQLKPFESHLCVEDALSVIINNEEQLQHIKT